MAFLETSAKTAENVKAAFMALVKEVKNKVKDKKNNDTKGQKQLGVGQSIKKEKKCC